MNRKTLLYVLALTACLLCSVTAMAKDAYALYRPSESKLIFFYDDMLSERDEPTYELNSGSEAPEWFESRIYEDLLYVEFHESFANARPTSTYAWFLYMSKLLSIKGLEYLNTSDVTNMSYMFYGCEKLKDIDVSTFNTANVTNMYGMFYGCNRMEHLDLSGFNTANVTNMGGMFRGCTSLKTVDLRDFDTENVTKVSYMFYQCGNLTTICAGDRWNMANVSIDTNMFEGCSSLVGNQGTAYDSNHTDREYAHLDRGASDPGYFTAPSNEPPMAYVVYATTNKKMTFYYDNHREYRSGNTYDLNNDYCYPKWVYDESNISVTQVVFDPSFSVFRPTTAYMWFYNMFYLVY